ncbi:hypothetical protein D9M69_522770 [compost metagenome]
MQVVEVVEALLDRLGDGDRLGVGQRAVVAAGAGDDVAEQADVRRRQAGRARLLPEAVQVGLGDVGEDHVLLVGDADLAEAEALGPVGDALHLRGSDVARRRGRAGLGRQHHRRIAGHLVRAHVARHPAGEPGVAGQGAAEVEVAVVQACIGRRHEGGGDPRVLGLGQLGRAVPEVLPLGLHLAGEGLDAQRLDQDLDARLVLVVAPAVAVVHAQDGLDVGQQVAPGQRLADRLGEDRRAPQAAADHHPQQQFAGGVAV